MAYVGMLPIIAGVIAVTAQPNSAVTFHRDVLPILQKGCQECHRSARSGRCRSFRIARHGRGRKL